jgi:hypothetical protein
MVTSAQRAGTSRETGRQRRHNYAAHEHQDGQTLKKSNQLLASPYNMFACDLRSWYVKGQRKDGARAGS